MAKRTLQDWYDEAEQRADLARARRYVVRSAGRVKIVRVPLETDEVLFVALSGK